MWKPDADSAPRGSLMRSGLKAPGGGSSGGTDGSVGKGGAGSGPGVGSGAKSREEGDRVIAGLTLYKVIFFFFRGDHLLVPLV